MYASSTWPDNRQPDVVLWMLWTVPAQSMNAPRSWSWLGRHTGATTASGDDDGVALGCAVGGGIRPIPPVVTNSATASATAKADSRNSDVERLIGIPHRTERS